MVAAGCTQRDPRRAGRPRTDGQPIRSELVVLAEIAAGAVLAAYPSAGRLRRP
jgi:hypothetical protein